MNKLSIITTLTVLTALLDCTQSHAQPAGPVADPPRLVSVRVAKAPTVDGKADDEAWRSAKPLEVVAKRVLEPNIGLSIRVSIRSAHTDTHIYFLVSWEDATEHISHKTWIWNAEKKAYEEGPDREDMFALAFEHTGVFTADMLSGDEAVWDVWHWKAFRTNPQGYAMDKTHRYALEKPEGKANSYPAKNGVTIWITRPEDAGDSVEKKQAAPTTSQGDRVPQYLPGTPGGSAADVRAKGIWADSRWTLEFERRLDTGNPDDTAFDLTRSHKMALAAFDQTGDMDKASGIIELTFGEAKGAAPTHDFEESPTGKAPAGFSFAVTGGGGPAEWVVIEESGAPSGRKVIAQTSADGTSFRFPLCVYDAFTAKDVEVSVKFKAVSGKVDQAAGIVWRYKDRDNYYIVRANALEDNVVLYKVERGKRTDLKPLGSGLFAYGKKAKVPSGQWNELRVVAKGSRFEVYLNSEHLFDVEDNTFTDADKVGLWTKADSVTYFDDLKIKSYNAR